MLILFTFFYILFIFMIVFASFFVITRLQKYSINPKFTKPLIFIFAFVTISLVLLNAILFINIPFEDVFYNNTLYY
jgi:hypothetical protein